jgi:hypothetical protein
MIKRFRVKELREVMEFIGGDKRGSKQDLQVRAMKLLPPSSTALQTKIKELHKSLQ